MTHIETGSVVVGVDGSPHSDAAVAWAVGYAALTSRPLLLAHALGALSPGEYLGGPQESRHLARIAGRQTTDAALTLAQRIAPGLRVDVTMPGGDARDVLVDLSERAAMTVVGTRGYGPVGTLLLGSVSVAVASHAHGAVAVVRPREVPGANVLVGASADGSDQAAIELAAELASAEGVGLDVVHAWNPDSTYVDPDDDARHFDRIDRHERALSEVLAGLGEKHPDVPVTQHLVTASAAKALVDRSAGAGVLVVGSRGRTGLRTMLGSVSRSVVEHAHCTVVVLKG